MAWAQRNGRRLAALVGVVVVAITFGVVLPEIADYGAVWRELRRLDGVWLGALAAATVLNVVTFAPPWMAALPRLRFWQALPFTQASTALTYVMPGGGLVGMAGSYALLRSWGFAAADVTRAVTLTGIWNQLTNLLLPVVAVVLLTAEEEADAGLVPLAIIGSAIFATVAVIFALVLWRVEFAQGLGDLLAGAVTRVRGWFRRGPVSWTGASFARFRHSTVDLVRRRWPALTVAAIVGNLAVFAVLLVALRSVGASASELTWIEAFAGWSVGRVLGLIPLTPGGLGVIEIGLTGTLVGLGGANAEVVAAVLLYRALTIVPTLAVGGVTMLLWRRLHPERRSTAGQESDRGR